MQVTIAGSGGWGTALAILLHENGHDVTLWSHFETESKQLAETHQNPYLPGVTLPEGLHYSADPACAQGREMVVFATPSFAVRTTARAFAPYLAETPLLVSVTKGIEEGTGYRMSELVSQETGRTVVALSGPSHAEEVSRGIPTGVVVACPERELAERVQNAFMCSRFRVYTSPDTAGIELGAALKNVIALCAGVCDGMGYGDNTKALLMTRGLAEVARLGMALGAHRETFAGLAGVGDLIVTCTSMHSRNRRAGILIGQGVPVQEAMKQVENGQMDVRLEIDSHDEMEIIADGFNKMVERLNDYINQVYVARICQKDAELNALKMQIQPHYLYNTLDVIRMTALEENDETSAELLECLAHQLRYVMGEHTDCIVLRDELQALREYFVIMKVRYEDRIGLSIQVSDEDTQLYIPKLLLQPVVENAIRHGLREKDGEGTVAIRVERKEDFLEIVVMDDGVGMDEEQVRIMQESLDDPEIGKVDANGCLSVGMKNVYDRIKLNCGKEYGFRIESFLGVGTIVTYHLPVWEEPENVESSDRG